MISFGICDDIGEVGRLLKEWTSKESAKKVLLNSRMIVAREGDKLVGCAQLIIVDDPFWDRSWGLVENVYVREGYRRQGVAKGIMKAVESQALLLGCEFVKLTSRKEEGQALYRALGYEQNLAFRKELKQ